jgi:hypothetical protein
MLSLRLAWILLELIRQLNPWICMHGVTQGVLSKPCRLAMTVLVEVVSTGVHGQSSRACTVKLFTLNLRRSKRRGSQSKRSNCQ